MPVSRKQRPKIPRGSGGFFPLFEAVGVVPGFEDIAVVGETVQERRGHLGVPKNLHPFAKAEIGGDDRGGFLVELAAQVEEQGPSGGREREIAEFIEDHGIDLGELAGQGSGFAQLLFPLQLIDQIDHGEEAHPLSRMDRGDAEGDRQVAFISAIAMPC